MDVHPPELAQLWYFNWVFLTHLQLGRMTRTSILEFRSEPRDPLLASHCRTNNLTAPSHCMIWYFTNSRPLVALQPMPGSSVVFLTLLSNPHGGNDHTWAYGQLIQGLTIDNMLPDMGIGQTLVAFCLLQHWDFPGCAYRINFSAFYFPRSYHRFSSIFHPYSICLNTMKSTMKSHDGHQRRQPPLPRPSWLCLRAGNHKGGVDQSAPTVTFCFGCRSPMFQWKDKKMLKKTHTEIIDIYRIVCYMIYTCKIFVHVILL